MRVTFTEEGHRYLYGDVPYKSVSTLLGQFQPQFDRKHWSTRSALQRILPNFRDLEDWWLNERKGSINQPEMVQFMMEFADEQEVEAVRLEILKEWKKENKKSIDKGNNYHSSREDDSYSRGYEVCPLDGKEYKTFQKERIPGYNESLCENLFDLDDGYYPELLIFDHENRLAGQSDRVFIGTYRKKRYIYVDDYKGLALDTPIATKDGWKTMGDIQVGDVIFDGGGNLTKVTHVSDVHHNDCYELTFDGGEVLIADHEHMWVVGDGVEKTTKELLFWSGEMYIKSPKTLEGAFGESLNQVLNRYSEYRHIREIKPIEIVPTKCLAVDSPSKTYLAGKSLIMTHNTNKKMTKRSFWYKNYGNVMLLPPLDYLEHSKLQGYELQISTYAWMLERFGFQVKGVCLHHLNKKYDLKYLKKEVELMIEHGKDT